MSPTVRTLSIIVGCIVLGLTVSALVLAAAGGGGSQLRPAPAGTLPTLVLPPATAVQSLSPAAAAPLAPLGILPVAPGDGLAEPTPLTTTPAAPTHALTAAALTAALRAQLQCLAPTTAPDPALDAAAQARITASTRPIPPSGQIVVRQRDRVEIVAAQPMLAAMELPATRCGETTIFGLPPLAWLPPGARWGLAATTLPAGARIVIVVEEG